MAEDRPVGWGIVGFGWVARDFMAPAIGEAGDRLAAVCDVSEEGRAAARARGARAHGEIDALLADPEVEAVYVATPNHLHRFAGEVAAAAGKAVLCEKPMAAALPDAEAMAAAVEQAGILYGTAFDQRHHPAHRAIRAALREGQVGAVAAVRILYACWLDSRWSACAGAENWRIDGAKAGGGALIDLAPHGLDLAQFLLDEPIEQVAAMTQSRVQDYAVDDGAVLLGQTPGGVLVQLHVAYNCPEALPRRRLEVVGSRGLITATNTMGQEAGGEVVLTDGRTGASAPLPFSAASPFTEQVRAFGRALRTGDHTEFSATRDLHTMRLLNQAYRSASAPTLPPLRGRDSLPKAGRERGRDTCGPLEHGPSPAPFQGAPSPAEGRGLGAPDFVPLPTSPDGEGTLSLNGRGKQTEPR